LLGFLRDKATIGVRAQVSWGRVVRVGTIVGSAKSIPDVRIKPVLESLDDTPIITPEVLKLCEWISEYYHCSLGETLRAAAGAVWPVFPRTVIYPSPDRWEKSSAELRRLPKTAKDILALLSGSKGIPQARVVQAAGQARAQKTLTRLESEGWIFRRSITHTVPVPADAIILGIADGKEKTLPGEVLTALREVGANGVGRAETCRLDEGEEHPLAPRFATT